MDGGFINPELEGCVMQITGGNDAQGFPMYKKLLKNIRQRLILRKGDSCFRPRREG